MKEFEIITKKICVCGNAVISDGYGEYVHEQDWLYGCNPTALRDQEYPVASVSRTTASKMVRNKQDRNRGSSRDGEAVGSSRASSIGSADGYRYIPPVLGEAGAVED